MSKASNSLRLCVYKTNHSAGWCFFVGLLEQELTHKLERLEYLPPQNLHVYCDFSLPSYKACFFPSGFLEQELTVKFDTLVYLPPHHLQ
jgi:hypothetical protein